VAHLCGFCKGGVRQKWSAVTFTANYGYDAASNRTSMTDPQNLSTAYTYDALNRLSTLAFNGQTPTFGFGYDALSRRNSLTRPNGVNTTYSYDPASSLLSVLHKLGTTTIDGASYTYDNAENRKTRTDKRLNTTLTYGYDNIYQLQTAKQGSTTKESYTYDIVGNRLSSLGVSPYTYNTSNELMSTPTVSYTYDNNGSVLTKSDGTQYTWDYENELTQVVLPGTGGTVNFKYDPFGRRIQKSFTQSGTTTTTDYLYDGANRIEDVDTNGNLLARYVQGKGIDKPLEQIASGTTSYYQQDGLGSVTSLSSTTGTIGNNTYTYDSYGNTTTSATVANPFQYAGRDYDPETGMNYYRARYYGPSIGRFVSEDPIHFMAGVNFYTYTGNSPTGRTDPSGLDWIYRQSNGNMSHVDNDTGQTTEVCTGYAGHNLGLNNPLAQDIPGGPADSDAGPLPQGAYTIGPLRNNVTGAGTVLPDSMRLIPDPTNDMLDRAGFLLHGGNMGRRSSSQGCIVLPHDCRLAIAQSDDKTLRVIP
jgi:RHS repeat-associated protein